MGPQWNKQQMSHEKGLYKRSKSLSDIFYIKMSFLILTRHLTYWDKKGLKRNYMYNLKIWCTNLLQHANLKDGTCISTQKPNFISEYN
jgi:hypothetical protein